MISIDRKKLNAFAEGKALRQAPGREHNHYSDKEYDFLCRAQQLLEELEELALDSEEFSEGYDVALMEMWCERMGYRLI